MVGAVVGVQPFGGEGCLALPKAGVPLYLYRLLANRPKVHSVTLASGCGVSGRCAVESHVTQPLHALREWAQTVQDCRRYVRKWRVGAGRNTTIVARADG